jgi:hypothetical protein
VSDSRSSLLAAVAFAAGRYCVALVSIARETAGDDPTQARMRDMAQAETAVFAAGFGLLYFTVSLALRNRKGNLDRRRFVLVSFVAGSVQYLLQWAIDPLAQSLSFAALMIQQGSVVALLAITAVMLCRRR